MDSMKLLLAAAVAKCDRLRAEITDAFIREHKAIIAAKKEGVPLPPNYWEPRYELQCRLSRAEELTKALGKYSHGDHNEPSMG